MRWVWLSLLFLLRLGLGLLLWAHSVFFLHLCDEVSGAVAPALNRSHESAHILALLFFKFGLLVLQQSNLSLSLVKGLEVLQLLGFYRLLEVLNEARDVFVGAERNALDQSCHISLVLIVEVNQILFLHRSEAVLLLKGVDILRSHLLVDSAVVVVGCFEGPLIELFADSTCLVVLLPLLGVHENVVGFFQFLEFLACLRVLFVFVGVVLQNKFAVLLFLGKGRDTI